MKNAGSVDRIARIVGGLGILSLLLVMQGPWRWVGLLGLVSLWSGLSKYCMINKLLGRSSCRQN